MDLEERKLRDDIVQTIMGYRPELYMDSFALALYGNRCGRMIREEETLEEAGVWNGDYLLLMPRG